MRHQAQIIGTPLPLFYLANSKDWLFVIGWTRFSSGSQAVLRLPCVPLSCKIEAWSDSHTQTKLMKWNHIVEAVAVAFMAVMLWYFVDIARRVETVNHLKVADCNSQNVTFTITLPAGHGFDLVLASPDSEHLSPSLRIHIVVSDPTRTVADFAIASGDIEGCNWINSRSDMQGYLLSWNRLDNSKWDKVLWDKVHGRGKYKFEIHFSEAVPKDSSLWLNWFHNQKD